MKATTAQERMDLLTEVSGAARDAMVEWCRRWRSDAGDDICLRWQTDGTAVVELEGHGVMRVQVEISTSAVEYEDAKAAVNKPTGFVFKRTWAEIPAGWFVATPNHKWFEVLATRREDGELPRQMVSLNIEGQGHEFPRDPAATVAVRKGSIATERDAAIDALRAELGAVTVIRDEGQFS